MAKRATGSKVYRNINYIFTFGAGQPIPTHHEQGSGFARNNDEDGVKGEKPPNNGKTCFDVELV
jgi:hypothetical protein